MVFQALRKAPLATFAETVPHQQDFFSDVQIKIKSASTYKRKNSESLSTI
jgi:hypothetical protein